jgi:hypothetical protein
MTIQRSARTKFRLGEGVACDHHGMSENMLTYRINVAGMGRQGRRAGGPSPATHKGWDSLGFLLLISLLARLNESYQFQFPPRCQIRPLLRRSRYRER